MSKFLKDIFLKNLTISEKSLGELNADLTHVVSVENKRLKEQYKNIQDPLYIRNQLFISYTIRFDGRGFRLYGFDEVMNYFREAKNVERFFFNAFSADSINAISGKNIHIGFDTKNVDTCYMCVQDDDKDWTDSAFAKIEDRLKKYKNWNYLIRHKWTVTFIQTLGAFGIFLISFWLANKIFPFINVNNAFLFSFIATFLLLANLWTPIYGTILRMVDRIWANITFRERKLDWLIKSSIVPIAVFIFSKIFMSIWKDVIATIIKK